MTTEKTQAQQDLETLIVAARVMGRLGIWSMTQQVTDYACITLYGASNAAPAFLKSPEFSAEIGEWYGETTADGAVQRNIKTTYNGIKVDACEVRS